MSSMQSSLSTSAALTDRLAFVDENNLPGIGAWLKKNKIASPLGYKERSGFCQYELYSFNRA